MKVMCHIYDDCLLYDNAIYSYRRLLPECGKRPVESRTKQVELGILMLLVTPHLT
jgi:hypothetical protein